MKYKSTREKSPPLSLSEALLAGLAPDGGLYVPEKFPTLDIKKISFTNWPEFAQQVLAPFFKGDILESVLPAACARAFQIPLPCLKLPSDVSVLELFHGPTCAFKDFGAQFLAQLIEALPLAPAERPRLVLVATSGDTGGAVAAAVAAQPALRAAIFYPDGGISPLQEQQLTCWPENVQAFAVQGRFDDCQALVKKAFLDPEWRQEWDLISANSISLGRLLPQMVYFAGTSLQRFYETGRNTDFIVPTGNLGNAMAAVWARHLGFPIGALALALNANRPLAHYLETGTWTPQASLATLANAMDVGHASNFERLQSLGLTYTEIKKGLVAVSANDDEIRTAVRETFENRRYVACPHTATAFHAQKILKWQDPVLVATAHAAKFQEVIEPLNAKPVAMPKALQELLALPSKKIHVKADLRMIRDRLR